MTHSSWRSCRWTRFKRIFFSSSVWRRRVTELRVPSAAAAESLSVLCVSHTLPAVVRCTTCARRRKMERAVQRRGRASKTPLPWTKWGSSKLRWRTWTLTKRLEFTEMKVYYILELKSVPPGSHIILFISCFQVDQHLFVFLKSYLYSQRKKANWFACVCTGTSLFTWLDPSRSMLQCPWLIHAFIGIVHPGMKMCQFTSHLCWRVLIHITALEFHRGKEFNTLKTQRESGKTVKVPRCLNSVLLLSAFPSAEEDAEGQAAPPAQPSPFRRFSRTPRLAAPAPPLPLLPARQPALAA